MVVVTAQRPDFQAIYPFYRQANEASTSSLLLWEGFYLVQFIGVEFMFRGFLLFALAKQLGKHAIWVSMLPYCMLHYHKTPIEALAAIISGVVLGAVALHTRTIIGGVMLHMAVALSMDMLALAAM